MPTDLILLSLILFFLMVLIHLAVRKPHHKHEVEDKKTQQHYQPLPTNINFVLAEDPWGWYPRHHDPYATYPRRHRSYR